MNASWMLNLYPRAWRARYEAEFRAMLDGHQAAPAEMVDILLGAVDAHLRPQVHEDSPEKEPPAPLRVRSPQAQAFFFAHAAFFLLLNAVLFLINTIFLTDGLWWAWYPLWATSMVLVAHAGLTFPWRDYIGMHAGLYALLNLGLVTINVQEGGSPWSIWPIVSLGVLLVSHGLLAFRLVSLFRAHVIATALATVELLSLSLIVDADTLPMTFTAAQLWVLVLAHWLIRFNGVSLFVAHAVTFGGIMLLLAASNAVDDSGIWWIRYPLVVWGIILAAHGFLRRSGTTGSDASWETGMLALLRARSHETPFQRRRRTLLFHGGLFGLGGMILLLIDLMDAPGEWWAMWPIGVWLGLIAVHAGWVLLPGRLIGLHVMAWFATSAGLIGIDIATTGGTWWYWPVMWWGVVVAIHAGTMLPVRTPFLGMHIAGAFALSGALILTNFQTGSTTWWWYPVAAVIFSVVMHAGWMLERSMGRGR